MVQALPQLHALVSIATHPCWPIFLGLYSLTHQQFALGKRLKHVNSFGDAGEEFCDSQRPDMPLLSIAVAK